jgi:hypothetical protein
LEEHELAEPSANNEPSSSKSLYQEGEGRLLITIKKHNEHELPMDKPALKGNCCKQIL